MLSSKRFQSVLSVLALIGLAFSLAAPAGVQAKAPVQEEPQLKPEVSYAAQYDVSAPLSVLAGETLSQPTEGGERPMLQLPKAAGAATASQSADAALQESPVSGQMPSLQANFDGIYNLAGVAPPDTQGDMGYDPATGTKYYFEWVNLHIQVWNVNDPADPESVLGPIAGNAIWSSFGGPCATNNDGDPIVLYDELAHRWFISQFSVSKPYYNCIAVSQSGDPTGAWYRYAFLYSDTKMNDYPKYGVWPDGYYMTVNQFNNGSTWGGAGAAVYERDALLAGNPAARQLVFDLYNVNTGFGGMLPADFEGTPPATGTPNFFAEVDDTSFGFGDATDSMRIWRFHVDWANPANSTFGLNGQPNQILPVADYTPICLSTRDCVPQPNAQKLDAIGDRLMYRLAYRVLDDGSQVMAVNHTVDADSTAAVRAGVRWYQLSAPAASTTWALSQQGTYAGDTPATDTNHRWMGSIGIDRMGNLALGYSVSSGTLYPSVGLVGRLATDPPNTLLQGERIAFSGSAAQSGVNRWGDYSSMSIDPIDGCTFWYTQEYSGGNWDWRTRIVSFRFPGCVNLVSGTLSGVVTATGSGAPIEGAQVTLGGYATVSGADGAYAIQLPAGTYSADFSAYGFLPETVGNINVTFNGTTTVNVTLDAAQLHTIHGTVTDATPGGHTWPLYARIDIAGYPNSPIFTDPLDGSYSVALPENATFGFTVTAMQAGYLPQAQDVTVPAADLQVDFGLLVDVDPCIAPGYELAGITEDFDGVSAPGLPTGWAFTRTAGANASTAWATSAGTRYPVGNAAISDPNVAYFNSYSVVDGNAARLYRTAPVDMTTLPNQTLRFWMFHDPGFTGDHDTLQVQVSIDGGATWVNVGAALDRVDAAAVWTRHSVDLSAYAGQTSLLVGFLATSAYGNDIHIDSLDLGANCAAQAGTLLSGYVYDNNTVEPLIGARVDTGAAVATTVATPLDPALADGFYNVFAPSGASVPVSAARIPYVTQTDNLTLSAGTAMRWSFYLTAGLLGATPPEVAITLAMNATGSQTLTLANSGSASADFTLAEIDRPLTNAPVSENLAFNRRHVSPKRLNDVTNPEAHFPLQQRQAPITWPNAGTVLNSFPTGLALPWGIGFNTLVDDVWVGNLGAGGGDDLDYRFLTNGTNTNDAIDTAPWMGAFAADMTFNPLTGTLWQVNVGGDNCIHELDLTTRAATGNTICPAFGTSERGLAFDPITNTYFSGSWNDSIINRFAPDGTILEAVDVALGIAGLAYNPATGHLFVTDSGGSVAFHVLDVNANYAEVGSFNVAALHGGEAGLEIDCDGHLWAANQANKTLLEITSDETGVCDWMDIPWLSESPASGTIATSGNQAVALDFNASGLMPGTYEAQLAVGHNTPYAVPPVPVTLTVTLAPGYGEVAGDVAGLEHCDLNPAPLAGALVEIIPQGSVIPIYTTHTGANGQYNWAAAAGGSYTVQVSADGYVAQSTAFTLAANQTIVRDFDLRRPEPCITGDLDSITVFVQPDETTSVNLTLSNTGAVNGGFELVEGIGQSLNEGFESNSFPPAGWSQVINNSTTWKTSTSTPHGGTIKADIEYDPALVAQNEWLLTQEMNLTGGTLSFWSNSSVYWCKTNYDNCDLNVWIVVGDVGGGDDVLVGKADDAWTANWTWAQSTFDLTPLLTGGPVRIGFQYEGLDGAEVALDDIQLGTFATVPWLSENPETGTIPPGGNQPVAIGFDATGMSNGVYRATLAVVNAPYASFNIRVTMVVGGGIYLPVIRR